MTGTIIYGQAASATVLISIREVSMKTYTDVLPGNDRGLSNNTVLSLYQESDSRIWIGTDGGGINSFNPAYRESSPTYPSTWEDKVASICPFTSGKSIAFYFLTGRICFQPVNGKEDILLLLLIPKLPNVSGSRGKAVNLFLNSRLTVYCSWETISTNTT